MAELGNTQFFKVDTETENGVKIILDTVYHALTEKGYNPVNQIVGYIMSGDPTYITNHQGARSLKPPVASNGCSFSRPGSQRLGSSESSMPAE